MIWRASLVTGTALLIAVLVQVTLLSRLGIPGATPDLVVVTVVAIGLAMGSIPGGFAGIAAAILLALAAPVPGLLGVHALVYVVIGFLAGLVVDPRDRSIWLIMGMVGLSTAGAVLGTATLSAVLGSERITWDTVPALTVSSALYGVLLAPLVVPLIRSITRGLVSELAR
jgi:rod shape-determining protein MreD